MSILHPEATGAIHFCKQGRITPRVSFPRRRESRPRASLLDTCFRRYDKSSYLGFDTYKREIHAGAITDICPCRKAAATVSFQSVIMKIRRVGLGPPNQYGRAEPHPASCLRQVVMLNPSAAIRTGSVKHLATE